VQTFIASELARQVDGVDSTFEVPPPLPPSSCSFDMTCAMLCGLLLQMNLFVQRYPKDPTYEKTPGSDRSFVRFMVWKWVASVMLTSAVLLPILGLAAQTVSEKESKMRDLLQISGLFDAAYWISYEIAAVLVAAFISIVCCLLLAPAFVLTAFSLGPYILLLVVFSAAIFAQLMAFGFVVFRSEYYGLPAFLISIALAVAGDYLANNSNITTGVKCKS
jgi:ABC-type Fe3+ transport system permease subunit